MLATVFVYGTLMPGHLRWGLIAPFARSNRRASASGELYDTGRGWPAARFAAPLGVAPILGRTVDGPIGGPGGGPGGDFPGWVVEVAPSSAATLLAQLDEVEGAVLAEELAGPGGIGPAPTVEYRRVRMLTVDGVEAWAYEALAVGPDWRRVPAWSGRDEN